MKTNMNIENKVKKTLEVFDTIEPARVPSFFKDKTLNVLFAQKEEKKSVWNWFTPQLQLATLACVILVNIYAINQISNSKYEASIASFASDYGISTAEKSSLFNL